MKQEKTKLTKDLILPVSKADKPRVALGMSGGVDSSVAAKLLQDQGYEVIGLFMKLWHDESCGVTRENACCDEKSARDARKVANLLGIKFYVVNAKEQFRKDVVEYFVDEYKNLRTPNPCVVCNEKIKFGWLLDYARKLDCDYVATGHYARIDCGKTYHLLKGRDEGKDQSYFLYRLNQEQLSRILFPVGEYTKPKVREMAKQFKLPVYEKSESQEICFISGEDYRSFMQRQVTGGYFNPGEIVNKEGNVVGKHNGLMNYTIGQRKGIEQVWLPAGQHCSKSKKPLYVVGFNHEKNELIVGEQDDLFKKEAIIENLSWTNPVVKDQLLKNEDLKIKIRYRADEIPCKIVTHNSKLIIQFKEPQRAITPGQSAVFYRGEEVIGGGIIV